MHFFEVLAVVKYRRMDGVEYALPTVAKPASRRWRASEAVSLAAMDVTLAGVSYLLSVLPREIEMVQVC